jgi:hypothetical protein
MEYSPRTTLSLAIESIRLAPGGRYQMPRSTVYENVSEFHEAFGQHLNSAVYCERVACLDDIDLVRLDRAIIHAGVDHVVTVGDVAIVEQLPPWMPPSAPLPPSVNSDGSCEQVPKDTVIVARYGAGTWGHWLGELLPKIVMVEAAFPGRFFFAVPQTYDLLEWQTFRDSIQAYGVPRNRLVLMEPGKRYKLIRPWAVTPVWSDYALHPAASERMRRDLRQAPARGLPKKVALLRRPSAARVLQNWDQIASLLAAEKYDIVDIGGLSFKDQAQTFLDADAVFSVLGSGLTGLIYSPLRVRVASAAPSLFGDRFFYALVVDRRGRYADVRGSITELDPTIPHRSSFVIDPDRLLMALDSLH